MSPRSPEANQKILLRVLIADEHAQINEGLTAMLSDMDGIAIFGCAQEPAKVVALVESVQPDVVILDLNIPGPIGLKTLRTIKSLIPTPVVIVLSHYEIPPLREACNDAGADYFLEKTDAPQRLREVLTGLLHGCRRSRRRA